MRSESVVGGAAGEVVGRSLPLSQRSQPALSLYKPGSRGADSVVGGAAGEAVGRSLPLSQRLLDWLLFPYVKYSIIFQGRNEL